MKPENVAAIYREQKSLKKTAELCGGKSSAWVRMRLIEAGEPINLPSQSKIDNIQEIVKLKDDDGLTYDAIAQILSEKLGSVVSPMAVRNRIQRYKRTLQAKTRRVRADHRPIHLGRLMPSNKPISVNTKVADLVEEMSGLWYAAEDIGESSLQVALAEASEKDQSLLGQQIFESTIEYVLDELIHGEVGAEVLVKVNQLRAKTSF